MLTGTFRRQGPAARKPQFTVQVRTGDRGSIACDDTVKDFRFILSR
jgi:hypothetical protein